MTVLATAGFVDRREPLLIQRSEWLEHGLVHSRRITPLVPVEYVLRWENATRAQVADVVAWVHQWLPGGVFDYTPPGGAPGKFMLADDAYTYRRRGAVADIELAIRQALAYD